MCTLEQDICLNYVKPLQIGEAGWV